MPAALHAVHNGSTVVVAPTPPALQEQLIDKDLPLLQRALPGIEAVIVKGRNNYVSLRRLGFALTRQQNLFERDEQRHELGQLQQWSEDTEQGDLADLGYTPPAGVWRQVASDKNNCLGRRCEHYDQCRHFYNSRRRAENANIIIVNHHLYFSDLALRDHHAAILPAHDVVIFDEAHTLEDVATEHLGAAISEAQVRFFLDGLYHNNDSGILSADTIAGAAEARKQVHAARDASQELWGAVVLAAAGGDDTVRINVPDRFVNRLSPQLDQLAQELMRCRGNADDDNQAQELRAQAERALELAGTLRQLIAQELDGYVYYARVPRGRGTTALTAQPLSVASSLREQLFAETRSVVLTSATLAADDSERFLFLRKRLGLDEAETLRLDSPFDFPNQARLLVNQAPIDPNGERTNEHWRNGSVISSMTPLAARLCCLPAIVSLKPCVRC